MRRIALLPVTTALLALAGCSGDEAGRHSEAAPSSPSASASTPSTAGPTTASSAAPSSLSDEMVKRNFISTMEDAGVIPQHGSAEGAVELAHAICQRYDAGGRFMDVMAVLADGDMSLDQMMDLEQAATLAFCPEHHVPG